MKIITKYFRVTITTYILLVMVFLLGLHAFIEFMREFPNIGTGYYGLKQALIYVLLMLPSDVYQFFPMAGLLGCVIGLGLLASHGELIIMRASGISLIDIIKAVAKSSIALIVVALIIGEVVAPLSQRSAIKRKTIAMSSGQALFTGQVVWIRSGNDYLQISNVATNNKELQGIVRYEFDTANKLKTASYAISGSYQNGKWIFKDVSQTIFLDNKTTSVFLPQQQWGINLNPRLNGLIHIDPDQKSLPQLYSYIKYRKQSGLNVDNYKFIFWQRIFAPLATLIMILFAVPFVFGPFRSVTMGLRMLVGIMLGFGFYILNQLFGSMSIVYHLPPVLTAILPMLIFMFVGRFMLFVVR